MLTHSLLMTKYRHEQGLSQTEMAEKLGITQQVYSNYERGRIPKIDFIKKYHSLTGIDLSQSDLKIQTLMNKYKKELIEMKMSMKIKDEMIANLRDEVAFLRSIVKKKGS